jgi:hypothetical protein
VAFPVTTTVNLPTDDVDCFGVSLAGVTNLRVSLFDGPGGGPAPVARLRVIDGAGRETKVVDFSNRLLVTVPAGAYTACVDQSTARQLRVVIDEPPCSDGVPCDVCTVQTILGGADQPAAAYAQGLLAEGDTLLFALGGQVMRWSVVDGLGRVEVVAGLPTAGFSGDGGDALAAQFDGIADLARAPDGALLVADNRNHRVRRIAVDGVVSTVAGSGATTSSGDGGPATAAGFGFLESVVVDAGGTIFVSEIDVGVVGRGATRVIAPSGTISSLPRDFASEPRGLAVDGDTLFIADRNFHSVRRRVGGTESFFAGEGERGGTASRGFWGDGGPATAAALAIPTDIAVGADGAVYIADTGNLRLRRVEQGVITTFSGVGTTVAPPFNEGIGSRFDDGAIATATQHAGPHAVAVSTSGAVYFAEPGKVRRIECTPRP